MSDAIREAEAELDRGNERKARKILWQTLGTSTSMSLSAAQLSTMLAIAQRMSGGDAEALARQLRIEIRSRRSSEEIDAEVRGQQEQLAALRRRIVTTETIPGLRIIESLGIISVVVAWDRHFISDLGSDLKGIVGGELGGQTKELTALTEEVMDRFVRRVIEVEAHGVVGFRFISPDTGRGSELLAYGTAVRLEIIVDPAARE